MKKYLLFALCLVFISANVQAQLGGLKKKAKNLGKNIKSQSGVNLASHFVPQRTPAGLALDPQNNQLYAYDINAQSIHIYKMDGEPGSPEMIPYEVVYKVALDPYKKPAVTNSLGLDFNSKDFNLGGQKVPANSLLIFNGAETTREITAVDKNSGAVIAGLDLAKGRYVGGVFAPKRGTIFLIDSGTDEIIEINPEEGKVLNRFNVNAGGEQKLNIFGGAIEYNDQTNTLFVTTDGPAVIREFSPEGAFIKDYNLNTLLESPELTQALKGLAFDQEGNLWLGATGQRRIGILKNLKK